MEASITLLQQQVEEALKDGKSAEEISQAVETAVSHARRKAGLLRLKHCESSLVLSALEHASEEIGNLPDRGNSDDEEVEEEEPEARAAAAAALEPLRQFAAAAEEQAKLRAGPSLRTLSTAIQRTMRGGSRDYDFERAGSVQATYYTTDDDFNPFTISSTTSWPEHCTPHSMSVASASSSYAPYSPHSQVHPCASAELPNPGTPSCAADLPTAGGAGDEPWGEGEAGDPLEYGYDVGSLRPPPHVMRRLAESIKRMGV